MVFLKTLQIFRRTSFIIFLTSLAKIVSGQVDSSFISKGKVINSTQFDSEITRTIKDVGIPAISIAIIDKGEIAYFKNYGVKSLGSNLPVTSNSVFEACSLSKNFLLYAVYQLIDQGRLDIDKPIYQYLEPGHMLDHDKRYRLITPRMILSHSSGLEDWPNENNPTQMDIISTPGEVFNYSSLGYNYLAAAIETIVKEPYDAYMQRLVITPLKLKNTFVKFKHDTAGTVTATQPADFVIGHDYFGKEFGKWKNYESVASSGISTTAEDYATLILNIFESGKISARSVKQICTPIVHTGAANTPYYYGTGFEIIYNGTDTIIGHGGSNPGFKAQIFYSTVYKRGLVFLTNSDLGKILTSHINEMTTGLNIADYYKQFSVDQYPSKSITLLNTYKSRGSTLMFEEVNRLFNADSLNINTLNQLGKLFINKDVHIAKRLLDKNISFFPKSDYARVLLGDLYDKTGDYPAALAEYESARQLGFDLWDLQPDINKYTKIIEIADRHSKIIIPVNKIKILNASNYSAMMGIDLDISEKKDQLPNMNAKAGSWVEYKIFSKRSGIYNVNLSIANDIKGGGIELVINKTKFSRFKSISTRTKKWCYKTTKLKLIPGKQTLRVNFTSGTTILRYIRFSQ